MVKKFKPRGVYESPLGKLYMVVTAKGNKVKLLSKPMDNSSGMKFRTVPNQIETGWRYLHDQMEY